MCAGTLYETFANYPDCNLNYDYTNGEAKQFSDLLDMKRFDPSNNSSNCFRSKSFEVASYEESLTNGTCKDMANKLLYSPPGNKVEPYYSVIQPVYLIQKLMDQQVKEVLNLLPLFLSTDYSFALKKYFCSLFHVAAEQVTLGGVFERSGKFSKEQLQYLQVRYNLTVAIVTLPRHSHRQVCVDYSTKCAFFLTFANKSKLMSNCNATDGALRLFPESNQTITT
jgi:hypothetical protein